MGFMFNYIKPVRNATRFDTNNSEEYFIPDNRK